MTKFLGIASNNPALEAKMTKSVSLCLDSIVYVVCFAFNTLLRLLFARKMFSVNLNYLNKA